MIKALYDGENTYFFIHVDAKCNQMILNQQFLYIVKVMFSLLSIDIGYNGEDLIKLDTNKNYSNLA